MCHPEFVTRLEMFTYNVNVKYVIKTWLYTFQLPELHLSVLLYVLFVIVNSTERDRDRRVLVNRDRERL